MQRRLRTTLVAVLVAALGAVTAGTATADERPAGAAGGTGSISGTVSVPAGFSAAGLAVDAYGTLGAGHEKQTLTAADGSYTLAGLADDDYVVRVSDWTGTLVARVWPDTESQSTAVRVAVRGSAVTGISVHLLQGATLSGTIRTTSDCDLTRVFVHPTASTLSTTPSGWVDADGSWRVTTLPTTTSYRLVFEGGWAGLDGTFTWPADGSYVTLTPGAAITDIDVTLNGPAHGCLAPRAYVEQLYLDLMGREGDPTGLAAWERLLVYRQASGATIANAFTSSDEFRLGMIDDTYDWFLGRGPDAAGRAYWLGRMRTGTQIEDIEAGFIASDEFYAAAGGTPTGWVTDLYHTVLDRDPAPSEVAWWVDAIGHGMNRGTVARGFLYSTEDLTAVVNGYYEWLLDRPIDPTGARDWVSLIQRGHRDEEIIAGIVSSDEYRANIPR